MNKSVRAPALVLVERIERNIHLLREHKIMLSADLSKLYGVTPGALMQAVNRNPARFPADFMFQLTTGETAALRSQVVTLKTGRGRHSKYLPYALGQQGYRVSRPLNQVSAKFKR